MHILVNYMFNPVDLFRTMLSMANTHQNPMKPQEGGRNTEDGVWYEWEIHWLGRSSTTKGQKQLKFWWQRVHPYQ